jgi:ABC-type branched-subunit amino acid transport system substrate-binding protein
VLIELWQGRSARSRHGASIHVSDRPLRIGAFAPLTRPGLVPAGRQLKAGLELGIEDVNRSGGVEGRLLELLLPDSAGLADRATSALQDLDRERSWRSPASSTASLPGPWLSWQILAACRSYAPRPRLTS